MLMDRYFDAIGQVMVRVKETQRANMEKAAELMAESVQRGGAVHVYDTGHIINSELINRAGGLMLLKQLRYSLTVENPVRSREGEGMDPSKEGLAKYVLGASNVRKGDVLIIGSVSGKSQTVVDLALTARDAGVKVVVITSIAYSSALQSEHSSGKRLFEVGDVVIDNCAPVGDAMLEVDGLEQKAFPASGISAAFIMWSICAQLIENLLEKGISPSVYKSVNFPGGGEYNAKTLERYKEKGY